MNRSAAEIVREYDFPGVDRVHGVTYDGQHVWFAAGGKVQAFGHGRARRWMTPPVPGFTTTLLLPAPLPSG